MAGSPPESPPDGSTLRERLGEAFFRTVPTTPGVYFLLGADAELLYVGKAKNLRTRLRSYARTDPSSPSRPTGSAEGAEKVARLVSLVRTVRWEQYATHADATARETELLRAIRPPFNDVHTDRSELLFVTTTDLDRGRVRFAMTMNPDRTQSATRVYGCFPFAAQVPRAFPALLRLLHQAQGRSAPSRLTRAAGCDLPLATDLREPVHRYLAGRSPRLVGDLSARLLDLDGVRARSVQDDLAVAEEFYAAGPREMRRRRLRHGFPAGPITAARMNELVVAELRTSLGADLHVRTRETVEQRIVALWSAGAGPVEIADALNAEGFTRLDGRTWELRDVDRVIRSHGH